MEVLAVIPARGGSKGIPNKNIRNLGGKPLIAWTIQAAIRSLKIDRIIVTTDDEEIAETSKKYGAKCPFLRPTELAQDETPGVDPIIHAVLWLEENEKYLPDKIIVLQPTSPFRQEDAIDNCISLALDRNAVSMVSVSQVVHHPYWMKKIDDEGKLVDFLELEKNYTRRQKLPKLYIPNGAIYFIDRNVLIEEKSLFTRNTIPYYMEPINSIDIDSAWDLYIADLIIKDKINEN